MARVKLNLPTDPCFITEIDVGIGYINYGGHMGNDSALTLLHEARLRYFKSLGFVSEVDLGGAGIIQADAVVVYKSQAFWGDKLVVELGLEDVSSRSFDIVYRVRHAGDGRDVLHAKTGIVFFDYSANKVTRIPEAFLRAIGKTAQQGVTP